MTSAIEIAVLLATLASAAVIGAAAQHVPIHGVTGTWALPGNVDKIYDGVNTLVVSTTGGTKHVMKVTKDTKVHGGSEALESLQHGTPVVVHYTAKDGQETIDEIDELGSGGLKNNDATVTAVDRIHRTITVRYAGGQSERLRLTRHAVAEGVPLKGNRVVVYYQNEAGENVAHYFKKK
jgi:hypothetical protein